MHLHKILRIASGQTRLRHTLSQELKISSILAQVLINRGISAPEEAGKFLDAQTSCLLDPFSFREMRTALERVKTAGEKKEKVLIFGDYDVDGITSVTLLKECLRRRGLEAEHYIPHRVREGYGLSKEILAIAKAKKIKLLITADCGITSHREIAELKNNHIDTIVTDHHEPQGDILPPAVSVINPKAKNSGYKFRELAGVGVAYKFCQALSRAQLFDELDLVALGTIADVVPLTGENRVLVKEGLLRLSKTKRPGLNALIEEARMKSRKFGPTAVSFILGPRLNASGRVDSAEDSLNLLMSADPAEAKRLAACLEQHNRSRQKIEGRILEEAEDIINREVNFKEHKVIVVAKEGWHQGVLGVVASKLADRFYRPAIVISMGGKMCKGSARSIKNFHLFGALGECREFLHNFGGHAHAAGLTIAPERIDGFRKAINALAHKKLSIEDLLPGLDIDMELALGDLNEAAIGELERLEPFGAGNPEPLFYTRNLKLTGQPQSLARQTLKFRVSDGKVTFQVIGFGMERFRSALMEAKSLDIVYTPRMDNWLEDSSMILEAKDIFFG